MSVSRRDFVKLVAGAVPAIWTMDSWVANAQTPHVGGNLHSAEKVYLDGDGVIRWKADHREVALFGANYCLASGSDYRSAGLVGADRKQLVQSDMAHFSRMGWDGLRLCFWGDWENSDKAGNLIVNDHLDLLGYLISQATARGIFMLLSPIVSYSSLWPDLKDDPATVGFSRTFDKSKMGLDPQLIAAQVNYLQQLLNYVNPYSQKALKDEPNILFVEMINEPWHHSANFEAALRYINALVDAVRGAGCQKLTFHNVSQDFGMAKPIRESRVQGSSFAWYPSGLDGRGTLRGNYLKSVSDYSRMLNPDLAPKARIVYEFDMPDVTQSCYYPAMTRTFRGVGAQFAAIFAYDMLATAPYNLVWQVHNLNMVYTPQKAVSAIIAGEVMRNLPRFQKQGDYPQNTRFGDFRVSYEENLSEMNSPQAFLYSNNTKSRPKSLATLQKIVGCESSPIVKYEGKGLYFLDKIEDGVWRLELYPDAVEVSDPFASRTKDITVSRLIKREWAMQIRLPDLTGSFQVLPLNNGNFHQSQAAKGRFLVKPGVFLLKATNKTTEVKLPEMIGGVGLREFACPAEIEAPLNILVTAQEEYPSNQRMKFTVAAVGPELPESVLLWIRPTGDTKNSAKVRKFPMKHSGGYFYSASVPPGTFPVGPIEFWFQIEGKSYGDAQFTRADMNSQVFQANITAPHAPMPLFEASKDTTHLDLSRALQRPSGDALQAPVFRFQLPEKSAQVPEELTASLYIGPRMEQRGKEIQKAAALVATVQADVGEALLHLTLVEKDGTAWSAPIRVTAESKAVVLPLAEMKTARWVILPQGFPGSATNWVTSTRKTGRIDIRNVERLQFSLQKAADAPGGPTGAVSTVSRVAIANIALTFDA